MAKVTVGVNGDDYRQLLQLALEHELSIAETAKAIASMALRNPEFAAAACRTWAEQHPKAEPPTA